MTKIALNIAVLIGIALAVVVMADGEEDIGIFILVLCAAVAIFNHRTHNRKDASKRSRSAWLDEP